MRFLRAALRACVLLAVGCGALVVAAASSAHANVSPPVAVAEKGQVFTLAVPTEEEDATTTKVELTPPAGFSIDSFADAPGWKREVQSTGSGEETEIQKVTWSGGNVPHEEAAVFQFLARTDEAKAYALKVRQTYSDGSVVDWVGPESADEPAPRIEAKSSFGGGGGNKTLEIVALGLAGLALVVAVAGLVGGSGRRAIA
jgi:uncharacterized protein YcnI